MEILLKELQQNEAVLSIQKKESVLGNLSYMEEALLLAAEGSTLSFSVPSHFSQRVPRRSSPASK